jgi:hypothetical protein
MAGPGCCLAQSVAGKREGRRLIKVMSKVANGVTKGKRRGQCVSGSYQNYQHVAVSHQLTDGGGERKCVGGNSESEMFKEGSTLLSTYTLLHSNNVSR